MMGGPYEVSYGSVTETRAQDLKSAFDLISDIEMVLNRVKQETDDHRVPEDEIEFALSTLKQLAMVNVMALSSLAWCKGLIEQMSGPVARDVDTTLAMLLPSTVQPEEQAWPRLGRAIEKLLEIPEDWVEEDREGPIAIGVPSKWLWDLYEAYTGKPRVRRLTLDERVQADREQQLKDSQDDA